MFKLPMTYSCRSPIYGYAIISRNGVKVAASDIYFNRTHCRNTAWNLAKAAGFELREEC